MYFKNTLTFWILTILVVCSNCVAAQEVFISEIFFHSGESGIAEAVEVAGPAGTILDGWQLVLYDGETGTMYDEHTFTAADVMLPTDTIDGEFYGVVVKSYGLDGIQDGSPDGVALINPEGEVDEFWSYGGTFTANDGPAAGRLAKPTLSAETVMYYVGYSIQMCRPCNDWNYEIWEMLAETIGKIKIPSKPNLDEHCWDCDEKKIWKVEKYVGIGNSGNSIAQLAVTGRRPGNNTMGLYITGGSSSYQFRGIHVEVAGSDDWAGYFNGKVSVVDSELTVRGGGSPKVQAFPTGEIVSQRNLKIFPNGFADPIKIKANGSTADVFKVRSTGQIINNTGIEITPTGSASFPILVKGNGGNLFKVDQQGKVFAGEVEVKLAPFPDYVFSEDYEKLSLEELQVFIQENRHLPNVPSAEEVAENGIGLGELTRLQMEKIEEMMLYILELHERVEQLEEENEQLRGEQSKH